MTSFWTTGGIRGGRTNLEKFKPRTCNMGFSREVYERVGGFKDMYGEDIDLSYRILKAGYENWYLPLKILHYKKILWRAL